jgi:hypothetical protein
MEEGARTRERDPDHDSFPFAKACAAMAIAASRARVTGAAPGPRGDRSRRALSGFLGFLAPIVIAGHKWIVGMDNPLTWLALALLMVPALLALASGLGGALAAAPFCCAGAAFWLYVAQRQI